MGSGSGLGNETKKKSVKHKSIVNWLLSTLVEINSISRSESDVINQIFLD